jgi:hypothetical protein
VETTVKNEQHYHLNRLAENLVTPARFGQTIIFEEMDVPVNTKITEGDLLTAMIQRERDNNRSKSRIARAFGRYLEEIGKMAANGQMFL